VASSRTRDHSFMRSVPHGLIVCPTCKRLADYASAASSKRTSHPLLLSQTTSTPDSCRNVPSSRGSVLSHRACMHMRSSVLFYIGRHGHHPLASVPFFSVPLVDCSPVVICLFVNACFESSARCRSFRIKLFYLPSPLSPLHLTLTATTVLKTAQSIRLSHSRTLLCSSHRVLHQLSSSKCILPPAASLLFPFHAACLQTRHATQSPRPLRAMQDLQRVLQTS
jgi:hypothetical protein